MTTTTNYGYTVVVGTDSPVNIQNDIAPNFTAIDTDLKAVSDSAITDATHTVTGTVHALVRTDADRSVFYFVATGDMVAGDTFTVDGVSVTARLANGEALGTGSFKINNTVMCILVGSVLNLMVYNSVTIPTPTASSVSYDNTGSGLVANDVQDAIDEIAQAITPASVSVTADGIKTMQQLLAELYVLIDSSRLTNRSIFYDGDGNIFTLNSRKNTSLEFTRVLADASALYVYRWHLETNPGSCRYILGSVAATYTTTEYSTVVPPSGSIITIMY